MAGEQMYRELPKTQSALVRRINSPRIIPVKELEDNWMAKAPDTDAFRLGRTGACEARLYVFTGKVNLLASEQAPVLRVAACRLEEAVTYVCQQHEDFDVVRVELVSLIELVSGSPLN